MTGVEHPLGRLDHIPHRDGADYDVHLYLGPQIRLHSDTAVELCVTLLHTVTHHMGNGHTGDAQLTHGVLKGIELFLLENDLHLGELVAVKARLAPDGDRLGRGRCAGHSHDLLAGAEFGVFVHGRSEVRVGAGKAVLTDVQTGQLIRRLGTQEMELFQEHEEAPHGQRRPGRHSGEPQELDPQLCKGAGVEKSTQSGRRVRIGQQSNGDRTPDAVGTMDTHSAHGIVHMQFEIQHLDHDHDQDTGHDPDDCSAQSVQRITARRDAHQPRQGGVQAHGNIRLAVFDPGIEHGGAGGHRRGDGGRQENGREFRGGSSRRAVEAVPAQPEDEHAQRAQRNGVAGNGVYLDDPAVFVGDILADARPEDDRADQCSDAAHHMDGAGTGVVVEAQAAQPAAAPDPVGLDGVDQQTDHRRVDTVGGEFRPLRHGSRDDGGRGGAEDQVENEIAGVCEAFCRGGNELAKTCEQCQVRLSDQSEERVLAHHERVSQQGEHHGSDAEVHKVLHNDVAGIFGSGKAGLHHGEARLHPENQRRADQKPEFYGHLFPSLT